LINAARIDRDCRSYHAIVVESAKDDLEANVIGKFVRHQGLEVCHDSAFRLQTSRYYSSGVIVESGLLAAPTL
jgi:hypothetical protein